MGRRYNKISLLLVALLDILLVNLGIIAAFGVRFGFPVPNFNFSAYVQLIPWLSGTALIVFYMFDLYADWRRKSVYNLIYAIVLAVLTLTLCTMALTFWHRTFSFPRSVIITMPFVQATLLILSRATIWVSDKRLYGRRRVLIVATDAADATSIAEKFHAHDQGWFVLQDYVTEYELNQVESKLQNIDVALISPNLRDKVYVLNACARVGKEALLVPSMYELFVLGSEAQQVDDMPVLSVQPPGLAASQALLKRLVDLVVSFVTLLVASPVLIALYILIPLTSDGPALYKQERLGRDFVPYNILKFRSMVQDAEVRTGPVLAVERDPRITRIGRVIRATRLDELPQLLNVLKGDMSLVGPRPERPYFIEQFQDQMPHYASRLCVKPGITGLAQVMAKYSTTVEDKLRFDLMYLKNYSLALDVKILLQTIRVVLHREQATGVKNPTSGADTLKKMLG